MLIQSHLDIKAKSRFKCYINYGYRKFYTNFGAATSLLIIIVAVSLLLYYFAIMIRKTDIVSLTNTKLSSST
jgi:hypothetical protein